MQFLWKVKSFLESLPQFSETEAQIPVAEEIKRRDHATSEETQDSSDNEFTFTLSTNHNNNLMEVIKTSRGVVIVGKINKTDVILTLDSGATTNILDNATFDHIQNNGERIQLLPTSIKIYPYDSKVPLPVQGKFEACLCNGLTTTSAMFYII